MLQLTRTAARAARCRGAAAHSLAIAPPILVSAVRHMLAMQAQNAKAARWAVGIRTKSAKYSDVQARWNPRV